MSLTSSKAPPVPLHTNDQSYYRFQCSPTLHYLDCPHGPQILAYTYSVRGAPKELPSYCYPKENYTTVDLSNCYIS